MQQDDGSDRSSLGWIARLTPWQCVLGSSLAVAAVALIALIGYYGLTVHYGNLSIEQDHQEISTTIAETLANAGDNKLTKQNFLENLVEVSLYYAEQEGFTNEILKKISNSLNDYDYYSIYGDEDKLIDKLEQIRAQESPQDKFLERGIVRRFWDDARSADGIFAIEIRQAPLYIDRTLQRGQAKICNTIAERRHIQINHVIDIFREYVHPLRSIPGTAAMEAWTAVRVVDKWECRQRMLTGLASWEWSLRISLEDAATLLGPEDIADAQVSIDPLDNVRLVYALRDRGGSEAAYDNLADSVELLRARLAAPPSTN